MSHPSIGELRQKRIAHVESHLDGGFNIERALSYIRTGQGDPAACVSSLARHAMAKAMQTWFAEGDLAGFRQWAFVRASLLKRHYLMAPDKIGPGGKFMELLMPLASNHAGVVEWLADHDEIYDLERAEKHKTWDFLAYQGVVALREDWPRLIERSERVLADPPKDPAYQKYLIDHRFCVALGRGDLTAMEDALAQMCQPKLVRSRANDESGYTEDLIFTPAVIFAKLAWRSGYPVKVDSPYVPAEWLPMDPLPSYDKHYDFLD